MQALEFDLEMEHAYGDLVGIARILACAFQDHAGRTPHSFRACAPPSSRSRLFQSSSRRPTGRRGRVCTHDVQPRADGLHFLERQLLHPARAPVSAQGRAVQSNQERKKCKPRPRRSPFFLHFSAPKTRSRTTAQREDHRRRHAAEGCRVQQVRALFSGGHSHWPTRRSTVVAICAAQRAGASIWR